MCLWVRERKRGRETIAPGSKKQEPSVSCAWDLSLSLSFSHTHTHDQSERLTIWVRAVMIFCYTDCLKELHYLLKGIILVVLSEAGVLLKGLGIWTHPNPKSQSDLFFFAITCPNESFTRRLGTYIKKVTKADFGLCCITVQLVAERCAFVSNCA